MEMPFRRLPELPRNKEQTGELGASSIWTDSGRPEGDKDKKVAGNPLQETREQEIARLLGRERRENIDVEGYERGDDR